MTIKEVEEKLDLPRATIRFYEKEGLINPERSGNSYRIYSDEDVATLKKIIILRKIGLTVSDIEDFLNEDVPLQELLEKNISQLQEQMKELEGAIRVSRKMQAKKEDAKSFNEEYYWEEIHSEEDAGNKFLEFAGDVIKYEKNVFFKEFDLINDKGQFIYGKKESVFRALGTCVLAGFVWFLLEGMKWEAFIEGFFWPFTCILIYSILGLPLHFLGKNHPRAARLVKKVGIWLGVVLLVVLILAVI